MHSKSVNWHSLCITFNYLMKILRITKARTSTKIQFKHLHAKIQWHFKSVKINFPSNKKKNGTYIHYKSECNWDK